MAPFSFSALSEVKKTPIEDERLIGVCVRLN